MLRVNTKMEQKQNRTSNLTVHANKRSGILHKENRTTMTEDNWWKLTRPNNVNQLHTYVLNHTNLCLQIQ